MKNASGEDGGQAVMAGQHNNGTLRIDNWPIQFRPLMAENDRPCKESCIDQLKMPVYRMLRSVRRYRHSISLYLHLGKLRRVCAMPFWHSPSCQLSCDVRHAWLD